MFIAGKVANPDCRELLNDFCFSADAYTALKFRPLPLLRDSFIGYDESFFWMNGYPALLTEEVQFTPEIHTTGDTLGPYLLENCGVNNLPLCTEVVRAAVATLATLAQVNGITAVAEGSEKRPIDRESKSGVLRWLPAGAVAFDAMGRRVLEPRSGIYFVRGEGRGTRDAGRTRKVVIQR